LYMLNTTDSSVRTPSIVSGVRSIKGALIGRDINEQVLINNRAFLISFARAVIRAQKNVAPGSVLPKYVLRHRRQAPPLSLDRTVKGAR